MTKRNVLETGFLASDFLFDANIRIADMIADRANALLSEAKREHAELKAIVKVRVADIIELEAELAKHEQALKDAVRVYGGGLDLWSANKNSVVRPDTHTGLLINVEKIGAKDGE
jgi:hypothetical protein